MFTQLRFAGTAVGTALLLVLAGCHSGGQQPAPQKTAAPSASPAASGAADNAALVAYQGMWQAFAHAGQVPDPDDPDLRKYATGDALRRIVAVLVAYRDQGVVTEGAPIDNASVTSAVPADAPTKVSITDCGDSTNWTKHNKRTGELIKDDPRGRRHITATVNIADDTWKVSTFNVGDIGSC